MPDLINADKLKLCDVVDCRPAAEEEAGPPIPRQDQAVDYMAKDYDSFLRAMLDLLPDRVPGWRDRTEADLGMAILELFAYIGDQLSYYQDRVANEAFLSTATQYESVRKHLRLVDYSVHPGVAAQVILAVETSATKYLPAGFEVRTPARRDQETVIFQTEEDRVIFVELNTIVLDSDAPANAEGTHAVLAGELDEAFLPQGARLYLEVDGDGEWARVDSVSVDTISHTTTVVFAAPLQGVYPAATATVQGNGVHATHGAPQIQNTDGTGLEGQGLDLEHAPLTYTLDPDEESPASSLRVTVDGELWNQVEDFITSGPADPHYRLTRGNTGFVQVRFGDGARGQTPAEGADIEARYRTGIGERGLVAKDTLSVFQDPEDLLTAVTNPQPSLDARDPETPAEAKLQGPRQVRRQNRAVIPEDYEEVLLRGVRVGNALIRPLHAKARFDWTGSWTTVYVSVDMPGRGPLETAVRSAFEAALSEKKLAGYDVRVEQARYAPLYIGLVIHVGAIFFARHVRRAVERVLSSRVLADRTLGFFAPERFDFGQDVYLSDLYAAVMAVEGVEALQVTRFKRLGNRYPEREAQGFIAIGDLEIVRLDNDPARPENGVLFLRTCGGKEG